MKNFKELIIFKYLKELFINLLRIKKIINNFLLDKILLLESLIIRIIMPSFYFLVKNIIYKSFSQKNKGKKKVILLFSQFKSNGNKRNRNFLSTENYFILNTLLKTKFAQVYTSFFDDWINRIPLIGDLFLLLKCYLNKIEYILLSTYNPITIKGSPRLFTLKFIVKKLNVKIISFWWDSISDNFYSSNKEVISMSFKNVYGDTSLRRSFYRSPAKDLNLGPAMDPILISPKELRDRDIDVIFLGSFDSYRSYRKEYLNKLELLKKEGYKILIAGGQGSDRLTLEEYFGLLGNSKICINFSESSLGKHQLKGRVYEALASKCLLLESENNQTKLLFKLNKEFVSFKDPIDMIEKIKYFLENQILLKKIAEEGNKKFCNEFNYESYWKNVLDF
jgi:glycosyltransferase involved in cell wall biosynthesis